MSETPKKTCDKCGGWWRGTPDECPTCEPFAGMDASLPPVTTAGCDRCELVRFFAETLWALPKTFADTIAVHPYDLADTIDRLVRARGYEQEAMAEWEAQILRDTRDFGTRDTP